MLGLREPDEYEIAVCGYTSDLGGKNLQSEWYAIKVPNPGPSRHRYVGFGETQIDPPCAKANVNGTIKTEPLHPLSIVRMMHQSTQHAFLDLDQHMDSGSSYLYSLGSDSDGDAAHPFESKRYRKVWSLNVNKPDAGWEAVPLTTMTFPNRYNPQSVVLRHKLYVLGGFSRSQFSAAKRDGWMESYHPLSGWKPLPNPPSGFSFNDDPLIFTALDDEEKILVAQYNHDDMNCDSATFYVYDVKIGRWITLDPPVRKLLARYPDRTGRRSVAVGNTLYWGSFEDEDINVQAYDLDKDIWFHGSFNIRPVLGKDEFLADNVFPASPPLLHLANQKFCLFLLTSIYDEKNCRVSNLYLNCLILNVSPINAPDNHQHDYYDHVCYKVRGDVNVDDKEYKANYHVHPHNHFWRLSISIASIQKYPLVNPIQLGDAVVLKRPLWPPLSQSMSRLKLRLV
ncbi:uncharacterized protein LOC115967565 isoform X2 [Quercus lobata]|uniref:uncharacterized protein LOC115967565 isoform X2 n=1 Tax=Quercus lobata TaxID=97700 RepID=UPI001247D4A1|nr:uncharacterized protein LOC115967565 isoform X2 [Quercus lobata]